MNRASIDPFRVCRQRYSYRDDSSVPAFADDRPIIVFDGLCGFCSRSVAFVLKHDHNGNYRFIAGQSPLGRALYLHYGLDADNFASNVLIENGLPYFNADGSLRIFAGLGAPWSWARCLRALPMAVLDRCYDLIARNRMAIGGRRETCHLPPPGARERCLS